MAKMSEGMTEVRATAGDLVSHCADAGARDDFEAMEALLWSVITSTAGRYSSRTPRRNGPSSTPYQLRNRSCNSDAEPNPSTNPKAVAARRTVRLSRYGVNR